MTRVREMNWQTLTCQWCQKPFNGLWARYCSLACRSLAWNRDNPDRLKAQQRRQTEKNRGKNQAAWNLKLEKELLRPKTCRGCSSTFYSQWETQKFCSNRCKPKPKAKPTIPKDKKCQVCGNTFKPESGPGKHNQLTCSEICSKTRWDTAKKSYRNRPEVRLRTRKWVSDRRKLLPKNHPSRLRGIIQTSIGSALTKSRNKKGSRTLLLLGCSIQHLREHFQSKFQPGMSWQNMGRHGWHIDHIRPCSSFDLSKLEEQMKCFHWTNLQPLWERENIQKSNKLDWQPVSTPSP